MTHQCYPWHAHIAGYRCENIYINWLLLQHSPTCQTIPRMGVRHSFISRKHSERQLCLYYGQSASGNPLCWRITELVKRVWEHKNKIVPGFTKKYDVNQLVFYDIHQTVMEAARREKRFKNWCRQWKIELIEKFNPGWRDLYAEICSHKTIEGCGIKCQQPHNL